MVRYFALLVLVAVAGCAVTTIPDPLPTPAMATMAAASEAGFRSAADSTSLLQDVGRVAYNCGPDTLCLKAWQRIVDYSLYTLAPREGVRASHIVAVDSGIPPVEIGSPPWPAATIATPGAFKWVACDSCLGGYTLDTEIFLTRIETSGDSILVTSYWTALVPVIPPHPTGADSLWTYAVSQYRYDPALTDRFTLAAGDTLRFPCRTRTDLGTHEGAMTWIRQHDGQIRLDRYPNHPAAHWRRGDPPIITTYCVECEMDEADFVLLVTPTPNSSFAVRADRQ